MMPFPREPLPPRSPEPSSAAASTVMVSTWESYLPRRCIDCGYVLEGLVPHVPATEGKGPPSVQGACPECGRRFDFRDPGSFTTKPPFNQVAFWLPGFLLALGGGLLIATALLVLFDSWEAALWIGVPFASGALLGYRVAVGRITRTFLGFLLAIGLVLGMLTGGIGGVFCSIILIVIIMGPIVSGIFCGAVLREVLKGTQFSQRRYLPSILILLIPVVWAALEGPGRPVIIETVSTSAVIDASADECWESLVFYEEVKHKAPIILRIGLARPLSATGGSRNVGDVKVCIYNRGRITKRITGVQPGERLDFAIIEQQIGYERDVELRGGSFVLTPESPERTRITLTTTYRPLLGPRFAWRWGERYAVRTLHGYVLEGIALEAAAPQAGHHPRDAELALGATR